MEGEGKGKMSCQRMMIRCLMGHGCGVGRLDGEVQITVGPQCPSSLVVVELSLLRNHYC